MRFLPVIVALLVLVVLMAGPGRRGLRVAERMVVVIIGLIAFAVAWALLFRSA